jgi:hypothetical protein
MLNCLGRAQNPDLVITDLDPANDSSGKILTTRRIIASELFLHHLAETFDQLGSDAPLGIGQLTLQQHYVGFYLGNPFYKLSVLAREPRI